MTAATFNGPLKAGPRSPPEISTRDNLRAHRYLAVGDALRRAVSLDTISSDFCSGNAGGGCGPWVGVVVGVESVHRNVLVVCDILRLWRWRGAIFA